MKHIIAIAWGIFIGLGVTYSQPIDTLCASQPINTYRVTGWPGSTYAWQLTGGTALSPNGADSIRVRWDTVPGIYSLRVTEVSTDGCAGDERVAEVLIINPPDLEIIGPADAVCEGDEVQIIATGGIDYQWSTGYLGDTLTFIAGFTETFTVESDTKCGFDDTSITVTVKPLPQVEADFIGEEYLCPGETTQMTAFGDAQTYTWIDVGTRQTVTVNKPGVYVVEGKLNECKRTDTLIVDGCRDIIIWNTFSPDGDGVNDFFEIDKIEFYPNALVEVYNRWGDPVFQSEGFYQPWDGTWQGNMMPVGAYYYIIDLRDGTEKQSGYVNLIRK